MTTLSLAYALADRAAIVDIEGECVRETDAAGVHWYDLSALVDPAHNPSELLAQYADGLRWAFWRGLIEQHPTRRHMVRLQPASAPAPHLQPLQFRS